MPPQDLLALQDVEYNFKNDSPFLKYQMERFYLRNKKLKNVKETNKQTNKPKEHSMLYKVINKSLNVAIIGLALGVVYFSN